MRAPANAELVMIGYYTYTVGIYNYIHSGDIIIIIASRNTSIVWRASPYIVSMRNIYGGDTFVTTLLFPWGRRATRLRHRTWPSPFVRRGQTLVATLTLLQRRLSQSLRALYTRKPLHAINTAYTTMTLRE